MRGRLIGFVLCVLAAVPSYAAITGTVMNPDGQPVAGAKVSLFSLETVESRRARLLSDKPERPALAAVDTDTKGRFTFQSPKDLVAEVHVHATGFAPDSVRVERDDDIGAIALTRAELRSGRVTASGKPVPGARVVWSSGAEVLATTDLEGRYSVPDPMKWADRLVVLHSDYAIIDEMTRRAMTQKVPLDRTLQAGATVTGRVVGEDGKTPLPGAEISIGGWPMGKSGQDGTFTISRVPPKWEWIDARAGALSGSRGRGGDEAGTIRLARAATVTGTLRDTKTNAPIAGGDVSLRRTGRMTAAMDNAFTDVKGNFTIANVAPGSYELFINRPGYNIMPVSVGVGAGEKVAKNVVGLHLARVSGMVISEDKLPVGGARVSSQRLTRSSGFGRMFIVNDQPRVTAPDGSFVLLTDPDEDVQIEAVRKGYPSARSATMRLAAGERKTGVSITIPGGVPLTGRVTDREGRPVSGATVVASEAVGMDASTVRRIAFGDFRERDGNDPQTDAEGNFTLRVKEGSYDINVKREGFAPKTVRAQRISASTPPFEITLDPGAEIAGRVLRNGVGVEGVRVNAFSEGMNASVETGPDGSFRISDLAPGTIGLNFFKAEEFIQQMRQVKAPTTDFVLELPAGGRVVGRVVDKTTKQPITTFEAGISPSSGGGGMIFMGPPQTRPFTSESGTFVLENVPVGQNTISARAPGYTLARVPNVMVEDGKATQEIEVALERGVRVKGRVTGPDGSPLSGAMVRIDMMTGGRIIGGRFNNETATTDASGEYVFESLEKGERTFLFERGGFVGTSKTVTLSDAETRIDAQLTSGLKVSGVVLTESGSAVPEASVYASSAGGETGRGSARTDASGNFQFESLAPGRYNFTASKQGLATGQLRDVDVSSGAPVRIVMKTGGTITGRVIGLSADELQNMVVNANNSSGGASSPVDANGNFRIEGAPTGTVRLMAQNQGRMMGGRTSPMISVEVAPGATVQQDIEFRTDKVIRGRITRDGRPAADVIVMFSPRNAEATTYARTNADRDGNYEVTGLDDATYDVNIYDMGRGTPFVTRHEVKGSGTFDIDMRSSSLRGRVLDAGTGSGLADAVVMIRAADAGGQPFPLRTAQTDAGGNFLVDSIAPGNYQVSAEKADYGTKSTDVRVGDNGAEVELKLASTSGVSLRVVDARDGRVLSAMVRVTDAQGRVVFESMRWFGGGGGAEPVKLALEPGTYRATVGAQGYAVRYVPITSPSAPTVALTPGGTLIVRSKASTPRRARLIGPDGQPYERSFYPNPVTMVDPSPGQTVMERIAPGTYTIQILGSGDQIESSTQVTVMEGQTVTAEI